MTPHERRLLLLNAGYSPTPVIGKAPVLANWQTRQLTNADEIRLWVPAASNTGILTRMTPALDLDLLDPDAAEAAQQLVKEAAA